MLASRAERWHSAMLDLLGEVNLCQPDELPQVVRMAAAQVADDTSIYLVDHEQRTLREFLGHAGTGSPDHAGTRPPDHTGTRPPDHTGTCPPDHTGTRPPDHTGTRPPDHTGTRPPDHTGTRPPDHTGTRPPDHTGTRPPDHTGAGSPDHTGAGSPDHTGAGFLGHAGTGDERAVEGSVAGLAYQRGQMQQDPGDPSVLWVPLLDSTERLGVLRVVTRDGPGRTQRADQESLVQFANLVGHLITAKLPYGDRLHRARSSQSMSVAAVLLRQLLPPSTCTSDRLVIAASLQPAYAVGGDAFDYSVDDDAAHIAILDGVGHGLTAGLSVAVALSAIRAGRRNGEGIAEVARSADAQLDAHLDDSQFVTAVLVRLHLRTGELSYVNAGHPAPIVFTPNGGAVTLEHGRRTPLGIAGAGVTPGRYHLQPGDHLLLYTDGVVESRNADGEFFTLDRLIDVGRRQLSGNHTPPEVARRINQAVVDFHEGPPADDSTILLVAWSPTAARDTLP